MNQYDRTIKRDRRSAITAFLLAVTSIQQNFTPLPAPLAGPPVTTVEGQGAVAHQEAGRLTPGSTIKRDIAGAETHSYNVALIVGQYLRVVAHQQGSNLALKLYSPAGLIVAEVNQLENGSSSKPISVVAQLAGDYRLEITPLQKDAQGGGYELSIDQLRPAAPDDLKRHAAETLFAEAEGLRARMNAETLKSAITKYDEALRLFEAIGDRSGEANTLLNSGMASTVLSDYQNALDRFARSIPAFQSIGDRRSQAEALNNIASAHYFQGDTEKSLEVLLKSLAIYKDLGDRKREGEVISNIGSIYMQMDDARGAIEYLDQALAIARSEANKRYESSILSRLGAAYDDLGESQAALDYYNSALALRRELNDKRGQAITLSLIGILQRRQGEPDKALDAQNAALSILQDAGDRSNQARALSAIGLIYNELGEPQKAEEYHNQALKISEELKDRTGQMGSLNNLAAIYLSRGNLQRATEDHNKALALARALKDQRGEARTLVRIGLVHEQSNDLNEAVAIYNQALETLRAISDKQWEAVALNGLGTAFRRLGEHEKAMRHLGQALSIRRALGERPAEAETLYQIAVANRDMNKLEEARATIQAAIELIESVRGKVADQNLQAFYFATKREFYELQVELLTRLHESAPALKYDEAALQTSERARARIFLDMLTKARVKISQSADPGLAERLSIIQRKISAKDLYRIRLLANRRGEAQAPEVEREINELVLESQQVRDLIRARDPGYAALTQPTALSAPEIKRLLDKETVLLEYLLGRSRSYLWLVTIDSIKSYQLPPAQKIDQAARRVHELLASNARSSQSETLMEMRARQTRQKAEFDQAAAELSRIILGPAASEIANKRLLIVSDGALQYIPFGVLPDPQTEIPRDEETERQRKPILPTPLIANHEIISLPSISALVTLRQIRTGRSTAPHALAVLADPVFSREDLRVRLDARTKIKSVREPDNGGNAGSRATMAEPVSDVERSAEDSGAQVFRRLRFSRQEAEAITGLLRAPGQLKALDFAADRGLALSGKLGEYRILHFATHGLLNNKNPALSGLVFSLVDEQGQPRNGFLRLREIYNMKLNADLVVLSGCQTALGQEVSGEGLIGLTRGFMYAGSPRVVASLWNVNDQATANLMKLFYRGMLKDGLRPAAALRAAQIAMWKADPNIVPYRWGAFILQGDWR
jgi:CHAT domain-containing protein/Tfp pilus assembly protein PilF